MQKAIHNYYKYENVLKHQTNSIYEKTQIANCIKLIWLGRTKYTILKYNKLTTQTYISWKAVKMILYAKFDYNNKYRTNS